MQKQAFIEYFNTHDLCSSRLGIRLLEIEEGRAVASLQLSPSCSNFMGAMHGGALATLADITAGCCLYYRQRLCVTLDTSLHYLRAVRGGQVTAAGRVLHAGGHVAVMEVSITDEEGALCCTATVSMYLTDKELEDPITY